MDGEVRNFQKENGHKSPLEKAVERTRQHFMFLFGNDNVSSKNIILTMISRFLIRSEMYEEVSSHFLSLVNKLGQWVAGDEKLKHFTGNSGNIRQILSKPDRIGLLFYELVGYLSNGLPYLLHAMQQTNDNVFAANDDTTENMSTNTRVVAKWGEIIVSKQSNDHCVLIFDSAYTIKNVCKVLDEKKVFYIGGTNAQKFLHLSEFLDAKVTKPGQWEAINKQQTNQVCVSHYSNEKGRKMCMSNAFVLQKVRSTQHKHDIPVYDHYGKGFSDCDQFNNDLQRHGWWPFTHGGRNKSGEEGTQDTFMWASILQNTYHAYLAINEISSDNFEYFDFLITLAHDIYQDTIK